MALERSLLALCGGPMEVRDDDIPEDFGQANIIVVFWNGAVLRAAYWRLVRDKYIISSFDHKQKYGLPAAIDAKQDMRSLLENTILTEATIDRKSGDLHFAFVDGATLEVFGFSAYEMWEISFPDGSGEYSNYVRE
jgi:hypothetical protein